MEHSGTTICTPEDVGPVVAHGTSPTWFAQRMTECVAAYQAGTRFAVFEKHNSRTTRFALDELHLLDRFVADRTQLGGMYFNLALSNLPLRHTKRGELGECYAITGIAADMDLVKPRSNKNYPTIDVAMKALEAMPLRYSLLIRSQGGFYPIWLFNEPIVIGNDKLRANEIGDRLTKRWQLLLEAKLRKIDRTVCMDATGDITHMFRIPGSEQKGHTVALIADTGQAYAPEDFEQFFDKFLVAPRRVQAGAHTVVLCDGRERADIEKTDKFAALHENPDLNFAATWRRNRPDLKDQSASGFCLSLTHAAVRAGWSDDEINDLIYGWRRKHGELDGYESRKVANDIKKVRDEIAAKTTNTNAIVDKARQTLADGGPCGLYADSALLDDLARLSVEQPAVYAGLRHELRESGVRIRDFDNAIKPGIQHLARNRPPATSFDTTGGFYFDEATGTICRTKYVSGAVQKVALCNFTARIVDETVYDDGVERRGVFGIEGRLGTGQPLRRIEIPAERFSHPESWVVGGWGSDAIVWPGEGRALAPAIQALSHEKLRHTTFTHTGWRKFGDVWAYLHGDGAVGPQGWNETVSVLLRGGMACYRLPAPPTGDSLCRAARSSLDLLRVGPDRITMPLLAAVYRAVLGSIDSSLYYAGASGSFKSELTALGQQHFGAEFSRLHLPGNWQSTANALEGLAFVAKDAVFTIDDFAPRGSSIDVGRMHKEADRIFRGQGNNSGRQRMSADGTPRADKYPRGLIVSSGEDIPRGYSARARMWITEVSKGDVDVAALSRCQRDAAEGLYARSMAGYLRWLAPNYEQVRDGLSGAVARYRGQVETTAQHARTPHIVAELFAGFDSFLRFAEDVKAVSSEERTQLRARCWATLCHSADAQAALHRAHEPAQHFMRLLAAALATGLVHLANRNGNEPHENPEAWGWRQVTVGSGQYARLEWQPRGRLVGWIDPPDVFLDPDAAFAEMHKFAESQGEGIAISATVMAKRLREAGYLARIDESRGTLTVRSRLQGSTRSVWQLSETHVTGEPSDELEDMEFDDVGNVGKF